LDSFDGGSAHSYTLRTAVNVKDILSELITNTKFLCIFVGICFSVFFSWCEGVIDI